MLSKTHLVLCMVGLILLYSVFSAEAYNYPFIGGITEENVKLRAGYNENFTLLKNLKKDEKLVVLGKNYNWYKIKLPDDIFCFVSKKYVNGDGIVKVNNLNVRAGAATKYNILGQLNKQDKVKIVGLSNNWYKIKAPSNCVGWVSEKYITYYSDYEKFKRKKALEKNRAEIERFKQLNNIKKQREPRKTKTYSFETEGVIKDLGNIIGNPATHRLLIKGKTEYYLKSNKINLYNYIDCPVYIWGNKKKINLKHPLIMVEKIEYKY